MLLTYSPDKRHYAYDGPKISCTETYARCYTCERSLAVAVAYMPLRCMDGGITHKGHPLVVALYSDPRLFCGCDVADAEVGTEKIMMYHHQMYKGRILALEPPDGLDANP